LGVEGPVRRFWKTAAPAALDGGWTVALDDRPVRTPGKAALRLPTEVLAQAVAAEWNAVAETIDPRAMPLTGLANAAIDRVAPDPIAFASQLARYGESDLACYRADYPAPLVDRQARSWDPLLAWARRRYDVDFTVTVGVMHVPQPPATVARLRHAVEALDAFRLAALSPMVTAGGSLVAALGVLERAFAPAEAWNAVSLDERWQLEQWGSDAEAEQALAARESDFLAGARLLELLDRDEGTGAGA
jgi:chaperone required for assembly of F1-ATPase